MTFVFNIKQEETMKKTYIIPEMEIVKIQHNIQLLAGSEIEAKGDYDDGAGITLGGREDENFEW